MKTPGLLLIISIMFLSTLSAEQDSIPSLDPYKIEISPTTAHQFVFSNKNAAFWFGETQQANSSAHQGLTILEQRYLADYKLYQNGKHIKRSDAQKITLFPDRLVRKYDNFIETIHFVDSLNIFVIHINSQQPQKYRFLPEFDSVLEKPDWQWQSQLNAATTMIGTLPTDKPNHIAVLGWGEFDSILPVGSSAEQEQAIEENENSKDIRGIETQKADSFYFAIVFDFDESALLNSMNFARNQSQVVLQVRENRLKKLLETASLITPMPMIDKAFAWALFSMDDLVTRQRGAGIWAGLPWFNNYWGRDSFITLPGALLCTGQFEKAREVLLSFAEFQNQDQFSPYYGRIPNRVMLNDIIYNTTDGTPWFVIACDRYVKYTGDTDFISLMFPVIKTAMEGALKNHVDEYGFLTHGDAETWMDAVGTEGPWSPRGNRAVEIQVLWLEQTRIAIEWAEFLGDDDWAEDWHLLERRLRRNFKRYFWDDQRQRLVDHLNTDNSADRQIRPHALFALSLPQDTLLMPHQEQAVLKEAMNHLVYPWGVSSLSQEDTNFHPYHHYPPFYVPDAAYHNGLVWTWLSGPLLSALISHHPELGFTLLREESRQILENDAIGSYSELLEAWPREGLEKPLISGTVSQAWNLAEFIRNWHQDVLGIRPDLSERRIDVSPGIPHSLKLVKFKARVGADILQGSYSRTDRDWEITLAGKQELPKLTVDFNLPVADQLFAFSVLWEDQRSLNVQLKSGGNKRKVFVNGKPMNDFSSNRNPLMDDLSFVKPKVDVNIPTLQGPSYDLIPPQQATQRHNTLTAILFDLKDPAEDDTGLNEKYTYPTNPHFKPGIFDVRRVRIRQDDEYYYFEIDYDELVDPGWKPKPGYQLTYTAITLSFEDLPGVRRTKIGMNANFSVPIEYSYNVVIYVGNGYRIVDGRGEIVAEYQPTDTEHPIGFVDEDKIYFSVPVGYLSDKHLRNAVVAVGGQDDHGGGGIGEFRSVLPEAGEWHGGGGDKPSGNSNVYDVMYIRR